MTEETQKRPAAPVSKPIDVNDIDASWDGTGSLDAHREKILATVKQPGFGAARLVKNGE